MDYGYRAARPYLLPHRLPRLWTFVTALVPDLKGESPQPQPLPLNQIVWANPTAHRILALAATMNFFDYQLLLRLGDMPTITQLNLTETIGQLLPMAKHTLLVLPCGIEDDEAFLQVWVLWCALEEGIFLCFFFPLLAQYTTRPWVVEWR